MGFDDIALVDGLSECLVRAKGMAALLNAAAEADSVVSRQGLADKIGVMISTVSAF